MPTIGYVAVSTRGENSTAPEVYGAIVTPGTVTTVQNDVAGNNAVHANAFPVDYGERVANASLTGDGSKPDGGF